MAPQGSVLVDQNIKRFLEGPKPFLAADEADVGSCSLDLRLTDNIWQVAGIPSMAGGFDSARFLHNYTINDFRSVASSLTMTPGNVYMVELSAGFALPDSVWGFINPKSSAGRIDLFNVVVAEGGTAFNTVPKGYKGKLYDLINPQSFPIRDVCGKDLVQMRFYDGPKRILHGHELQMLHRRYGLVGNGFKPVFAADGLVVHLDLHSFNPPNLVANSSGRPISLNAKRDIDPTHYFRIKKYDSDGRLFLEPNDFILVSTLEPVRIPPGVCAEMVPYSEEMGELRSHYAGFLDAGFGYGVEGEADAATVVCEIRNISGAPIILSHGQPIAMLRYEYLWQPAAAPYGSAAAKPSHYQSQTGVKLAKFFRPWPDPVPTLAR